MRMLGTLVVALAGVVVACSSSGSSSGGDDGGDASSSSGGDGGAGLCQPCTTGADCASGMCEPFRMMTVMLCTSSCMAATDCPAPSAMSCTPKNYCKCN